MIIRDYLMKAIQDDARRAGERDRLLREARRVRRANRQRRGRPDGKQRRVMRGSVPAATPQPGRWFPAGGG